VSDLRTRLGRAWPLVGVMIVVIVVALVCVGLYVGDRYAHRRAEGRVAAALQPPLGTPARPQVDIEGFPFLTQIAAGSVGKMQIVADQLGETTNAPVILAHADLVMTDVVTNDWFKTMKITHTEGTGLIDYTKLSSLTNAPLRYGSEGRVEIVVKTTVVGREVEAVITGAPRLNADEQTMTLSGWLRPQDVSSTDFAESARVADAEIVYQAQGSLGKPRSGILTRVLGVVWP